MNDTTSSSVIKFCKQQFACHGIPDTLVSDNGLQLRSYESAYFSKTWQVDHVFTSPYHSQSNGKVESAVKIAKNIIKKSRDKKDLWLSILDWRNTPKESINISPVQRLFSRRTKTILPIKCDLLEPKVEKGEKVVRQKEFKCRKSKFYHDRSSRPLSALRVGQMVRIQPLNHKHVWKLGKVVMQYALRSYVDETEGRLLTRNRKFLKVSSESAVVNFDFLNESKW